MVAGFARMERYFELAQAQHVAFRAEMIGRFEAVETRLDNVENRLAQVEDAVTSLGEDLRAYRDWTASELADIRRDLNALRPVLYRQEAVEQGVAVLREELRRLEERTTRLEQWREGGA